MLERLARQLRQCQKQDERITQLEEDVRFFTNLLILLPYGIRTSQPRIPPPRLPPSFHRSVRPKQGGHL